MNRRLMASVASMVALLAVILAGIFFFQQPAKSASRMQDTDLSVTATEGNAVKSIPSPTLTTIPEVPDVEIQSASNENSATPIP